MPLIAMVIPGNGHTRTGNSRSEGARSISVSCSAISSTSCFSPRSSSSSW
jgi:hypothetical protein